MTVWLSRVEYAIGDTGPAGGFIFYENPNYKVDGWRYLEAAPIDQSAGAKWGCFPQKHTRCERYRHRYRQAEHRRHVSGVHRA